MNSLFPRYFRDFRGLEMDFRGLEMVTENDYFRIRKSSNKFHIKIRKTHFRIRKWNFKKVPFKNDKSKEVLEIDVEKDGGIFFSITFFWLIWIVLLRYKFLCNIFIILN